MIWWFDIPISVIIAEGDRNANSYISKACASDTDIEVLGNAHTGLETISMVVRYTPSVLLLTPNIPDMDIISIIRRILTKYPTPIVVLWSTNDQPVVSRIKEMDVGIIDFVKVDRRNDVISVNEVAITTRVHILSKLQISKFKEKIRQGLGLPQLSKTTISAIYTKSSFQKRNTHKRHQLGLHYSGRGRTNKIIIIGTSTGGPRLLTEVVPKLPVNLPPIIVVQHMPVGFIKAFAKRLDKLTPIDVAEADSGEILLPKHIYLAPGGFHLEFHQVANQPPNIILTDGPPVNFVKPSVDVTLRSACKIYGSGVISVILTGMGSDGKRGCFEVKSAGGKVLALNQRDSDIYGMNKAVIDAGLADEILNKKDMVSGIIRAIEA